MKRRMQAVTDAEEVHGLMADRHISRKINVLGACMYDIGWARNYSKYLNNNNTHYNEMARLYRVAHQDNIGRQRLKDGGPGLKTMGAICRIEER